MTFLPQAVLFLAAAVLIVPLAKRAGLGAVLGYLVAGLLLGPHVFAIFTEPESILHVAELGVVLLLFVIGLELQPRRLMTMRGPIFGLGGLQMASCGAALAAAGWMLGLAPVPAVAVGLTLAASSTALVLQLLAEEGELNSAHGRAAFGVLLFQDLAAIPLIAFVPMLGSAASAEIPGWREVIQSVAILIAFLVGGRLLLRGALRFVATSGLNEILTAMALFTVGASAFLFETAGLSAGLGAFLAGVLLAENEYRHQLEADIEPFKGLLLGLFFMAVGMSIDLTILQSQPGLVAGLVAGLVLIKSTIIAAIGWMRGLDPANALRLGLILGQGGEFAFVILSLAGPAGLIDPAVQDLLILTVGLSMITTPLLARAQQFAEGRKTARARSGFDAPEEDAEVIIAGFGRVGQIVARVLRARGVAFTALDPDPEQVELARRFGSKVYFGDPARLDVLRAARADRARHFIIALDDPEHVLRLVERLRAHYPHLALYVRARNRQHVYRLWDLGVTGLERDTFHSSLALTRRVLGGLGYPEDDARLIVERFREHDEERLRLTHAVWRDSRRTIALAREAHEELAEILADDALGLARPDRR